MRKVTEFPLGTQNSMTRKPGQSSPQELITDRIHRVLISIGTAKPISENVPKPCFPRTQRTDIHYEKFCSDRSHVNCRLLLRCFADAAQQSDDKGTDKHAERGGSCSSLLFKA